MSYLRPLETDSLPHLNGENASARRIRALEEELAVYRRGNTPRAGILKYADYDNSSSRRAVTELQDQVRTFREELRKKDALIQHLSGKEPGRRYIHIEESTRVDPYLERSRTDMNTPQLKYERAAQQLKEYEMELEAKDIKIRELQNLVDANRETDERFSDVTQSLRDRVRELELQLESYRSVSTHGEHTISSLQHELRDANDKILNLEARLREQIDRTVSAGSLPAEQRLSALVSQLAGLLNIGETSYDFLSTTVIENIVIRLTDLVQENALLKGKLVTLSDTLNNTQLEGKASRDTIMRLVSEMAREQKVATRYTAEVENLRAEREHAIGSRVELEREIDMLKERLEASQRMVEATNAELEMRGNRLAAVEREMLMTSHNVHSSATAFQLFREQIANLLGTAFETIDHGEESLKEAIRKLVISAQDHRMKLEEYESRVKSLSDQLDKQVDIQRELAVRADRFEGATHELDSKLRCATGELAAGDVLREGYKFDKEKYMRGLQKLGEIMKMDHISLDLGLDSVIDGLLVRAEQLVRQEGGSLADRSTHVYNLQRKVRNLKDQLESKEMHIDLLRKKLTGLEERIHGRVALEKEVETESVRVRKLERLVDKYKLQLTDARQEIQNLKAQLMGTSELQMRTSEQRRDVDELAKQVVELEELRRKQARKISALKEEMASADSQTHEKRLVADNAVQALSSELRTTKTALDSIKYREKQLLDFRGVISRMLGLDANTLAVPDYEIISRLEKLLKAQSGIVFTPVGMPDPLAAMNTRPSIEELGVTDPVIRRSRDRSRRRLSGGRARARSMSPMKRDPRVY